MQRGSSTPGPDGFRGSAAAHEHPPDAAANLRCEAGHIGSRGYLADFDICFLVLLAGVFLVPAAAFANVEDENAKLKRLLAETMLDNAMLKDVAARKW